MARTTPCVYAKNSLRNSGTTAVECNCCGLWEKVRLTNAHRELIAYAVSAKTRKKVRL
jgi:hypothetical protein